MTEVKAVERVTVEIKAPVKIETKYRRAGNQPKDLTLYVLGQAIVRGQGRLLATIDPSDLSDGKLFLAYVDSVSKLARNTTIEPWDIEPEAVAEALKGLFFFGTYSSAFRQVQHVDEGNEYELLEAVQAYGAVPFGEVSADSVSVSLIITE